MANKSLLLLFLVLSVIISSQVIPTMNIKSSIIKLNPDIKFDPEEVYNGTLNPVFHKINYIEWPLSTYPALVEAGKNFTLHLTNKMSQISIILHNRKLNLTYQLNKQGNDGSYEFTFYLDTSITPALYDLILYDDNGLFVDIQTHSVRIFESIPINPQFAHISDLHIPVFPTNITTVELVKSVFGSIIKSNVDFVIATGDIVSGPITYQNNETTQKPPMYGYEQMLQIAFDVFDQFEMPIFVTSGNHDWLKVYPGSTETRPIWESYFGKSLTKYFSFGEYDFIGFNTRKEGISDAEFNQVKDLFYIRPTNPKILFAHYDFGKRIRDSVNELQARLFLYGHDHETKIQFVGDTLFVEIYNAYDPGKMDPQLGFHQIKLINDNEILINNKAYTWTNIINNQKNTAITTSSIETSTSNKSIFNHYSFLFGLILIIMSKKLKYLFNNEYYL